MEYLNYLEVLCYDENQDLIQTLLAIATSFLSGFFYPDRIIYFIGFTLFWEVLYVAATRFNPCYWRAHGRFLILFGSLLGWLLGRQVNFHAKFKP